MAYCYYCYYCYYATTATTATTATSATCFTSLSVGIERLRLLAYCTDVGDIRTTKASKSCFFHLFF